MATELNDGVSFCLIGETAVVLDLKKDKYLAVPAAMLVAEPADASLLSRQLLRGSGRYGHGVKPFGYPCPLRDLTHFERRTGLITRVSAIWAMVRSVRRLRKLGMDCSIQHSQMNAPSECSTFSPEAYGTILSSFDWADLLFEKGKSCLTRSLAMRQMLYRHGLAADLVIGVQLYPFSAHAWLQRGETLLNDSLDRIRNYQPIAAF